jgi:hypothetical protein
VNLPEALPTLLPLATAWAEGEAKAGWARGVPLDDAGTRLARKVGVVHPERIRVVTVRELPMPTDPLLNQAARAAGLLGPGFAGLTLGHTIFLRAGDERIRLLAHECRHVAQYESFGSIGLFLATHLRDVARVGYWDSPLEQDARAFEHHEP